MATAVIRQAVSGFDRVIACISSVEQTTELWSEMRRLPQTRDASAEKATAGVSQENRQRRCCLFSLHVASLVRWAAVVVVVDWRWWWMIVAMVMWATCEHQHRYAGEQKSRNWFRFRHSVHLPWVARKLKIDQSTGLWNEMQRSRQTDAGGVANRSKLVHIWRGLRKA